MDRQMILDHLNLARRHVAEGETVIARQKEIVASLERDGHDTVVAKETLAQFLQLQTLHEQDRDRLVQELADCDSKPS